MQNHECQKKEKIGKSRAPQEHILRHTTQKPEQQGMQREESELLAACVVYIERRVQVTGPGQSYVVGHVSVPQYFAEFSRNLGALKRDERIVGLYVRILRDSELSNTDQNEENKSAREYEGEECFTYAAIVPQANEPCLVEQFS